MSPNHFQLARQLGQGEAGVSRLLEVAAAAAGVFQVLVALAERRMQSPSERFVMQLRSAEEVNLQFPSAVNWDQGEYTCLRNDPQKPPRVPITSWTSSLSVGLLVGDVEVPVVDGEASPEAG
jgi:hypothetical protein